jgi:hypothetical protein
MQDGAEHGPRSEDVTWTIHEGSVLDGPRGPVLGSYRLPSHVLPVHVRPLPLDDGRSVDVIDFFDSGTTRIVGATLRDPVETDGISTAATDAAALSSSVRYIRHMS